VQVRAIVNPRAGVRSRHAFTALAGAPTSWRLEIETTNAPGHARKLAQESAERGDEVVLAVGGDGTVNEVAAGLLGSHSALGIIPAGSGNGLARTLGIALDPRAALLELADGVHRRMDVGRINGEVFFNVAGIGFDAFMAAAFHDWGRPGRRRGVLPYVWLGVGAMARFVPEVWQIEANGQSVERWPARRRRHRALSQDRAAPQHTTTVHRHDRPLPPLPPLGDARHDADRAQCRRPPPRRRARWTFGPLRDLGRASGARVARTPAHCAGSARAVPAPGRRWR
jgi:hypothetical protein